MFSFLKKKQSETLYNPVDGTVIPLSAVNDPVFSEKMMGDGFAVTPTNGAIFAPVQGIVTAIFPTKHAITIKTTTGANLLIHMGMNTVELNGVGFTILVTEGQKIDAATQLAELDLHYLADQQKDQTIIIVFPEVTNPDLVLTLGQHSHGKTIGTLS